MNSYRIQAGPHHATVVTATGKLDAERKGLRFFMDQGVDRDELLGLTDETFIVTLLKGKKEQ